MSSPPSDEQQPVDKTAEYEQFMDQQDRVPFVLRLYVAGLTTRSTLAINTIKDLCEQKLKDRCDLEVIDVSKRPDLAREDNIIAAPTLIRKLPLPLRRLIGDLADTDRVLVGLDLVPRP